jgi:hypothetical protein
MPVAVRPAVEYGTGVVLLHLLVNLVHGTAHAKLHIQLGPAGMLFVLLVIGASPLLAMLLLWTSRRRFGLILLALSMAASLLFGLYNHFVAVSPDHVGRQAPGPWATTFAITAYVLLLTEALGTYIGLKFFFREAADASGIPPR